MDGAARIRCVRAGGGGRGRYDAGREREQKIIINRMPRKNGGSVEDGYCVYADS